MGLEPTTSAVTGRRANQLRYRALLAWLNQLQNYNVTGAKVPNRSS